MKHDYLRKFFVVNALVTTLNRMAPLKTLVMDLIYPEAVRKNHPYDRLTKSDLQKASKNIPLVTRGSASYPVKMDKLKLEQIDPANLTPSITIDASDLNRFKTLTEGQQQILIDNNIDFLRKSVRKSTEAMAMQSIMGKLEYDIRNGDGTMDVYSLDFGTPKAIAIDKKWDAAETKAGDITASVGQIVKSVQETSDGTDIVHLIKWDVYSALVNKAGELNNPELIKVFPDHIQIGSAKFILCSPRYYSYKTKSYVDAIPNKTVVSIAKDDTFALYYCALDSIDANFAALPFYVKPVEMDDPEGVKLIAQSRPMPLPNVDAIRTAQVLA